MTKRFLNVFLAAIVALCFCCSFVACSTTPEQIPLGPVVPDKPDPPDVDPPDVDPPDVDPPDGKEYAVVTLDLGNGETDSLKVEKGKTAQKPSDPTYGNNVFLGWYRGGAEYDWTLPVSSDITVKALWEKVYGGALKNIYNGFAKDDGAYVSLFANSMAVNETDGFDRGTVQVTVTSTSNADSGIVVGLDSDVPSGYWEGEGVSYYFFFVSRNGSAPDKNTVYLGKTDNGKWTALKVVEIDALELGVPYTLKAVLDGTDLRCYVDGKLYIVFSERRFLTGTGYGIRAGAGGVRFSDFSVTGKV